MNSAITVSELKVVEFPAGYLQAWGADSAAHVAWVRRYTMVVSKGRGGVTFHDDDFRESGGDRMTTPFAKAALRRCFTLALRMAPAAVWTDTRTGIHIRRIGKSAAYELDMPCGENACIKKAVLARLVRELAA
jgi:hypothetical protein